MSWSNAGGELVFAVHSSIRENKAGSTIVNWKIVSTVGSERFEGKHPGTGVVLSMRVRGQNYSTRAEGFNAAGGRVVSIIWDSTFRVCAQSKCISSRPCVVRALQILMDRAALYGVNCVPDLHVRYFISLLFLV